MLARNALPIASSSCSVGIYPAATLENLSSACGVGLIPEVAGSAELERFRFHNQNRRAMNPYKPAERLSIRPNTPIPRS